MLTLNPKPASEDDDGKPKPPTQIEKFFAVAAHLAGVLWLPIIPITGLALVVPFIVLQFSRVHSEFTEQHAVQASNFQLLMGCFYLVALALGMVTNSMAITHLLELWVAIVSSALGLWEGAKAINGWKSKYPLTLKLFK
ncbi:Uncharacterized conserved protein, Tic20 family [Andreprevotia lacus DSM 23236]|jgi:uncharacterized Tic20 family protein|uniref:Uncharacterized conserved protein, Tic20 family n=1 Tax=Andreprevotia lacus DSM 23236 TaxID=1121001 RepID=A0A1W1XT11_9NEIS|nr:DUF4870 domain-containing protein [Andreprevotia lacus]SMC27093.1 Uncharacterized conserved protein, Tic20 family [Andreprevotia lacus DSM 23236]